MKASELKYAEIFSFLALIFFMMFILSLSNIAISPPEIPTPPNEPNTTLPDPIILDEEAGKFDFPKGEATLPQDLKDYILKDIVPKIEDNIKVHDINTIEVIGHTDGQPVSQKTNSNLDLEINKVAVGKIPMEDLKAGSNADLGLMRALAVVQELQRIQKEGKGLKIIDEKGLGNQNIFRVYSAGPLILTDGEFAQYNPNSDAQRRRIEIRFTKLPK